MKILWIFLGGHHKIGLYLGVISSCVIPHKPMKIDERYAMTSILRKYIAGYTVLQIFDNIQSDVTLHLHVH